MKVRSLAVILLLALTATAAAAPRFKAVTGASLKGGYGAVLYFSEQVAARVDGDSNMRDLVVGGAQAAWFPGIFRIEKGEVRYERDTDLAWTLSRKGPVTGAGMKGKGWVAYDIAWNGVSSAGFIPGPSGVRPGERLWEARIPLSELAASAGMSPQDQALMALARKLVKGKNSVSLRIVATAMDAKAFTCVIAAGK